MLLRHIPFDFAYHIHLSVIHVWVHCFSWQWFVHENLGFENGRADESSSPTSACNKGEHAFSLFCWFVWTESEQLSWTTAWDVEQTTLLLFM